MLALPKLLGLVGVAGAMATWSGQAVALTATMPNVPSQKGEPTTFELTVADNTGPVQVRWDLGDETRTEFTPGDVKKAHTYDAAGHYSVIALVKDETTFTSVSLVHTVHEPLLTVRPTSSSDLVYDSAARRLYVANYDSNSVSAIDAVGMSRIAELPVARGPVAVALAPLGKLWVLHRDAHEIAIVDRTTWAVVGKVSLPYASQPMGLALGPKGEEAYVSLMALGKLIKLDVATGALLGEVDVGSTPRGVSVSGDGASVYVTRFITEGVTQGEVVRVAAATFSVDARFALATDTTTPDTDQMGRGLPNYLFSIGLSPDGLWGWVAGKKDNIYRGPFRDGFALNRDNTVRPMLALLDLQGGVERLDRRIDLDDRSLPSQVVFTPLGDYAFVAVSGSALVEVRDAYTGAFITALKETGIAPSGLVLTDDDKLFVHAALSRSLAVYDVGDVVRSIDQTTRRLADVPTVDREPLDPQVLRGKQLFFNSSDIRMSDPGYISCASCHLDGMQDGRVWDFGGVGEGLRNSVSLLGRRGMAQGNVNWSGSFDEIQDIDDNIRAMFGGKGFLTPEQVATGTVATALGDRKAGLSPELDAIAAFLGSLGEYHPSPYRNADGSLTADGRAGRVIFERLGCDFCHGGPDATDSKRAKLHDVGTLKETSGARNGQPLFGLDTPTLRGVWETAPYLHDGSAATLRDVLTTQNPDDRHAYTSALTDLELEQLIAYVQQLDGTIDPEETDGADGGHATGGSGAAGGTAGATTVASDGAGCSVVQHASSSRSWMAVILLFGRIAVCRRRRRS